jgi:hypothetical protein
MMDDRICDESAEHLSALTDGETISAEAVQHIGGCAACQSRLRDYLAMGAELRRVASLEISQPAASVTWKKMLRTKPSIWQKGWETMRIPKFAFALLVIAVLALASSLAVVKVGAHSSGSVLVLDVKADAEHVYRCILDTHKSPAQCTLMSSVKRNMVGFQFEILGRDGDRVQLGLRSLVSSMGSTVDGNRQGAMRIADLNAQPQTQYWFEAGQSLKLDLEEAVPLEVTGEWMDHVPTLAGMRETHLDPGPDELRVVSPLLIRDKQTIADMEGGSTTATRPGQAVLIYNPGLGRFLLSLSPMKDAVQAKVRLNRIAFKMKGQEYLFLTGAPVSREEHAWVRYEPGFKPSGGPDAPMIGAALISQIAPEAVMPSAEIK